MKSIREVLAEAGLSDDRIAAVIEALPAPDSGRINTDPDYLRGLLNQAGIGTRRASDLLGVGNRDFRHYLAGTRDCPYLVQYALEMLAFLNTAEKAHKPQSEADHD
jgi:hypothetical protein